MLDIARTEHQGTVQLVLKGSLDPAGARVLQARLAQVRARRPRRLHLDLARVDVLTAAGLRVLLDHYRSAPDLPTTLHAPRPALRRLLQVSGLPRLLPLAAPPRPAAGGGGA